MSLSENLLVGRLPSAARRVLISLNPKAGARSNRPLIDRLASHLEGRGLTVELFTDIELLAACVAECPSDSLRAVVAAGGDGTFALVASRTPPGTPLMVFPLGTENLLSKHLEIAADPEAASEIIANGVSIELDAGRLGDRLFTLMVGCGFDAEVVRRLHEERKGHIHHLSYAKPIFESLRSYRYPELRVYCDPLATEPGMSDVAVRDTPEPVRARWAFVVNVPRYAGGLQIVPRATGTDGLLDVCTFKEGSLWNALVYLGGVLTGQHTSWNDCVIVQTRRVRIEADEPVPVQLDGDPGGFLPVEIEVLPRRLKLLVAAAWSAKQISNLKSPIEN